MPTTPFAPIRSNYVVIAKNSIDTDQIIPARFLTTTLRSGLGAHLFAGWRYDESGAPRPGFPVNDPRKAGARVLVAGHDFGCGSSREHAVWALMAAGFAAVVSTRFADIFAGNALGNGLLPVTVGEEHMQILRHADAQDASAAVEIDLESQMLLLPDGTRVGFPVAPFARYCLLRGVDELDVLRNAGTALDEYEASHPPVVNTLSGWYA